MSNILYFYFFSFNITFYGRLLSATILASILQTTKRPDDMGNYSVEKQSRQIK